MLLGAVARPRWNPYGQCTFDGKIGNFPLINRVVALRDSKNRPRGSIEIKPTESDTQEVRRSMLIHGGLTFIFAQQPPNSLDCNIHDLGFFRSIQSLMHKNMPKNMT